MTARSAWGPPNPAFAAASYISRTVRFWLSLSLAILSLAGMTTASAAQFARGEPEYEDWKVALECRGQVGGKPIKRGDLFYFVGEEDGYLAERIVPISAAPDAIISACEWVKPSRTVDEMRFFSDFYHDYSNFTRNQ
ncbi:hypothetical protein [Stappia indica]|uniref:hypothetical protein n=1 Tax=Stappia indica TaxID=538381 RepID=UPI001CD3B1F5|nr:hypothetical protein [Stappia indica]MCA1298042.1 hypothetical protein [Stappia indica]